MELAIGDTVVYSLPLDGERVGTLFTSIGRVSGISQTHVTIEGADQVKFPYSADSLPVHHHASNHSNKAKILKEFKIPRLFVRRVMSKKSPVDPKIAEGVYSDNVSRGYTMWSTPEHDYVFCILTFDMRKLTSFANPRIICISDIPITERVEFDNMISARPLDANDPAENLILKQNPKAVVVTMVNSDYFVPLSVASWSEADFKAYIAKEIRNDFVKFGCNLYTQIKAVRKSSEGYYAFTTEDQYIDLRAFLGTVYIDQKTGELKVSSHDEETRTKDESTAFFRAPYLKEGYGLFMTHEIPVSETKKMTGFYNMSLCLNNLMILLDHGLKHPLFGNSSERALELMDNPDCPGDYVHYLVAFYFNPLSRSDLLRTYRRKYLWWLP